MKSVNFEFLKPDNTLLAELGGLAEATLFIDPGSALTRLRSFAETFTQTIYHLENLPFPPQSAFYEWVKDPAFQSCVSTPLIHQINFLRVQGNETAHGAQGDLRQAKTALGTAHQLALYLAVRYYGKHRDDLPSFKMVHNPLEALVRLDKTVGEYKEQLQTQQKQLQEAQVEQARVYAQTKQAAELSQTEQAQSKAKSKQVANSLKWDEATTRKQLIDVMLEQAGWDTKDNRQVGIEVELPFPDNPSGKGYADYVLWDDNGQPLAVIEAKKASNTSLQAGREQARLYADAFERKGCQRPVIFYSNGYETFIWDDQQYNTYRSVYGFYSKASLAYLIYQRTYRNATPETFNPDLAIADRPYQIEAVKTVAAHFQQQQRRALIIQATGTGKTRVAIALAELLMRMHWAKRVLFLCDRTELRTQADDAFRQYLPSEPRCVIGQQNTIDKNARIYIATYPGMMNRFSQLDTGFFDLVIADESHRSIYNKYRDLLEYFDALKAGLTATPVRFVSRNTFELFGCRKNDPTFEFGLDEAVNNEPPYLVPFRVKDLTTDFLRGGIHYNDLNDDQKRQLEEDLGEEQAKSTTIEGSDIGRRIFSEGTDSIILENLMKNGIKDETGSLVGKTIIFARSRDHAEHLEKLFCELYPQHGARVCKVIHHGIAHVQSLIREFKQPDNPFRIAISVDMLDTGIDVPEVVNLVFAKPVKSWVKFWQMIGRGTRLCPNLFGSGKHKTGFLIFDHYSNFDYFEEEYKEPEDVGGKPLLQTLFEVRMALAEVSKTHHDNPALQTAVSLLRDDIGDLPRDSIAVRRELRLVDKLLQGKALERMTPETVGHLARTIAPLMAARVLHDKHAIALDSLIARTQMASVEGNTHLLNSGRDTLMAKLNRLKTTIAAVRQKEAVIQEVQRAAFWQDITVAELERIRKALRDIMKYCQSGGGELLATPVTETEDQGIIDNERPFTIEGSNEALLYRRRLKAALDEMIDSNDTLQKIRLHQAVTEAELGILNATILSRHPGVSLDLLNEFYGRTADNLDQTLREIMGLDPKAVEAQFTRFLHEHPELTAQQTQFMNLLKNYIVENGGIRVETLYDIPFTSLSHEGIDGVFDADDVDSLFAVLEPFLQKDKPSDTDPAPPMH